MPDAKKLIDVFEELGFVQQGVSGNELIGTCIFCGKEKKLFINGTSGQWNCKGGGCMREGNVYTFIEEYFKLYREDLSTTSFRDQERWDALEADRGIPFTVLHDSGMIWDGTRWAIPHINQNGTYTNIRFYNIGKKLMFLPFLDASVFNANKLTNLPEDSNVFICEGEWDAIALQDMLAKDEAESYAVIGIPGAGVFKEAWIPWFKNQNVAICYDADEAGQKGTQRIAKKLKGVAKSVEYIKWPEGLPPKFDIRDFYKSDGNIGILQEMLVPVDIKAGEKSKEKVKESRENPLQGKPKLSDGGRPVFEEVLEVYKKWLYMTPELIDALRIIFATVYSNQLQGDPLWIHLAGPPGSGKSELLTSTHKCDSCISRSTVTAHSLVSGFQLAGREDPSLLPQLFDKTFVLKDFTEVLQMPKMFKDDVYHILRGAYDGYVEKPFGNGVTREYRGYFSFVTGVTQAIFAETGTSLGERFLIYHVCDDTNLHADAQIMAAMYNSGDESRMKDELADVAKKFLEYQIDQDSLPVVEKAHLEKLVSLAQIVAMLRAQVERSFNREQILYRPQHEMGTRIAKQLKKLLVGLALTHTPPEIQDDDFRIVQKIGLDTCVGFNLDIVGHLSSGHKHTAQQLSEELRIPLTTIREKLDDLEILGVLMKEKTENPAGRGAPIALFSLSKAIQMHWDKAGLERFREVTSPTPRLRMRFHKSGVRDD